MSMIDNQVLKVWAVQGCGYEDQDVRALFATELQHALQQHVSADAQS